MTTGTPGTQDAAEHVAQFLFAPNLSPGSSEAVAINLLSVAGKRKRRN